MIVFDVLLDFIGYRTTKYLLPLVSFGAVKVDALTSQRLGYNWLGFQRDSDGKLLCSSYMAAWVGVLIWILVLIVLLEIRSSIGVA